jgi:thymidylate kinase
MNKVIVIEGVDGTGKTSVAKILTKKMKGEYYKTPPKELDMMKKMFNSGEVDAKYLFYLATLINSSKNIQEISKKRPVIVDRFLASTICYHQLDGAKIELVDWKKLPIINPDFHFCLEVSDKEEWIKRIKKRDSSFVPEIEYTRLNNIQNHIKGFVLNHGGVVVKNNSSSPENAAETMLQIIRGGRY